MSMPADMDPSKTPLMLNPSGDAPNFTDPPTLLDTQLGVGVALIVIGAFFVTLRLVANLKTSRGKLCLDDMLCIFAFAAGVAYWTLSYLISKRGTARHAWDVPISVMTESMLQLQVAYQFLAAPTLWSAKAAILALYIRIFGVYTWLRRTAYVWIVFMALFYGMNIVIAGVYCIPRPGEAWMGASFARCSSSAWLNVVVGVFSCLADLIILTLPFPLLLRLHISMAKKLSLSIIFGTGLLLVVLSVVSLYLRVRIFQGNDPTWNATVLGTVTVAEIFGTIVVSCAPAMSSFWLNIIVKSNLWSELRGSFFSSRRSQGSKPNLGVASPQNDSNSIFKETTEEMLEDGSSRKSSNPPSVIPLSSVAPYQRY